jgi:hypothetical protein
MTETTAPRFTKTYEIANRIQWNDVDVQDGVEGAEAYPFVLIDRTVAGAAKAKGCACGCGLAVASAKREFLPGHDQRLMGILVRAHREELEVSWQDGPMTITGSGPMDYAELVLNEAGRTKLAGYLANEPKRARKTAKAAKPAAEVAVAPKTDPLPKIVKVGRWEYPVVGVERDGNGKIVKVEYTNKQNAVMSTNTWGKLA